MIDVRLIALGDEGAGDDAAALLAARRLGASASVELVLAGRPGLALLDLLDPRRPVVLADVVQSGAHPGHVHELRLVDVVERVGARTPRLARALGPAEALRLAKALGRPLPDGLFLGIEGVCFELGAPLSASVEVGVEELASAMRGAIAALRERQRD